MEKPEYFQKVIIYALGAAYKVTNYITINFKYVRQLLNVFIYLC